MSDKKWLAFKEKLNAHYRFPTSYRLTCVIGQAHKETVCALLAPFSVAIVKEKDSSNGKYRSLTFELRCADADQIIAAYKAISGVKNIVFI